MSENQLVWLIEERVYGTLLRHGAYFSLISYVKMGMDFEVLVENDDFEIIENDEFEVVEEDADE